MMLAALTKRLTHWGVMLWWSPAWSPTALFSDSRVITTPCTTTKISIKLVVRLLITPVHCRMLLLRHAWNVAAIVKPSCVTTFRARWNVQTTRFSVPATSRIQIKKQIGTAQRTENDTKASKAIKEPGMLAPLISCTFNNINRPAQGTPTKKLPTSILKHRSNHSLHPGRFSASQMVCKRFWMTTCNPRNSQSRRTSLRAALHSETNGSFTTAKQD